MQENKDNNNTKENNMEEESNEKVKTQTIDKTESVIKKEKNEIEKVEQDNKLNKTNFMGFLKKGVFDTLGIMFISIGGLAILGLIFKYILGYYIIDPWGMLFIIFIIASIFYPYINYIYKKKKKKH